MMKRWLMFSWITGCFCAAATAAVTDFENASVGPFTELTSPAGKWLAEDGHVQIDSAHADLGKRCLHLVGGQNHAVELQLASVVDAESALSFRTERWTSRSPFVFRVEARAERRWQEVYHGDAKVKLGGFHTTVHVRLPAGTEQLRFSCTAPKGAGVLIDDVQLLEPKPMKIVSVTTVQDVTPMLVRNESDPLIQLKIVTEGGLEPLNVSALTIGLDGTTALADVSAVRVQAQSADHAFAAAQSPAPTMVFRGSQPLQEGENTFVVSAQVATSANADHRIDASCLEVELSDGQKLKPDVTAPAGSKRIGAALRKAGDDGSVRYRIPGLAVTPKGTLISVYDIRWIKGGDLPGHIDVGMSRSTDGGRTWEPMTVIMDMGKDPKWSHDGIGDPCILVDDNTGTIWVAATWSHGNRSWRGSGPGMTPEETGQYMLVKSEDDGLTWSAPINITEQIKRPDWCFVLPSPGQGITMRDGTLVFPSQFQDTLANKRVPYATIIYSRDQGKTWTIGEGARSNTTECRVVELGSGSLMLNMRDNRGGSRAVCTTKDMGKTWAEHATSRKALPEPVCNAGLVRLTAAENVTDMDLLVFCNPNSTRGRHHMSLKASFDDGETWPERYHLLLDAGTGAGYSAVVPIDKETLGVLYEGSRANLVFQRIKISDLLGTSSASAK